METLKVYSNKRSATYLALRMNFILDNLDLEKRESILKGNHKDSSSTDRKQLIFSEFALIVPARERKHFLTTCRVALDS